MTLTYNEMVEKIAEHYDPDELVDILEIESTDLLWSFPDKVEFYRYKFFELEQTE